ncbi:LacI family DNA-binding transcriptional regulator [Methylovirgula sp. 4M-Z18]|uniref:LacI family DNA-binding transcriptional regulator n=1 Tax=Methylovirgula sp. 4M-Z18 TaxID=2293567 RepID=UPI000E2F14CB|nr:LacI family DNA-binding transcriptional regulator [Methylovirgula sp. 4M-Z18]RFB79962.1 LacI family DNA-binding transcriptional regulator [Methylovirgula sp. 4M-Z18]
MSDVARKANVSTMTVSRAFRSDTSINEETRGRILAAAAELGYILDQSAVHFSSGRSGFVAVTIPSINNANFADMIRGMTEGLRGSALEILLGYTDYDVMEEERLVGQLLGRRPEAIIVTGGTHTDHCRRMLERSGIPVIETWDLPRKPIGHVVGFSNADAARLMVDHFVSRGYKRMGFIGGDTSRDTRGLDRRRGFVSALESHGLDATRLIASGIPPISMREGAAALVELMERWPDTEAVMCVSDLSAFGALMECKRRDIAVPDKIAIGGFGAYDLADQSVPSITTIDVGSHEIGAKAAELVLSLLAGHSVDAKRTTIRTRPEIIIGGTT